MLPQLRWYEIHPLLHHRLFQRLRSRRQQQPSIELAQEFDACIQMTMMFLAKLSFYWYQFQK
jgi:hypothetical protein